MRRFSMPVSPERARFDEGVVVLHEHANVKVPLLDLAIDEAPDLFVLCYALYYIGWTISPRLLAAFALVGLLALVGLGLLVWMVAQRCLLRRSRPWSPYSE